MAMNSKKVINGWCMYDWANSVYSLVITTAIFPIYYNSITTNISGSDIVNFFGIYIVNSVLYSYSLSFSFLILTFIQPVLSGIADFTNRKTIFLKIFMYLGSFSCMSLYFFDGNNVEYGIIFSMLASLGFSGSLVFYNAFLPEIVDSKHFDKVSARGYSFGYVGSVILLIISLIMITFYEFFGFNNSSEATRFTFLLVGIWWILFSQITFIRLNEESSKVKISKHIIFYGLKELKKVWVILKSYNNIKLYLFAFFFYWQFTRCPPMPAVAVAVWDTCKYPSLQRS